jgi:hypothetical protein
MIGAFINVVAQGMSHQAQTPGDFALAFGIGAASGFAGGAAGQAVGGVLGTATTLGGAIGNGALSGAAGGFVGGFVGGAGNAWANDASFGGGLMSGLKEGGIGALINGVIGGALGGFKYMSAVKKFNMIDPGDIEMTGKKVTYSNGNAKKAQMRYFGKQKGLNELHADGIFPGSSKAMGVTVPLNDGSRLSNVYLKEAAFANKFTLFLTMGHEFVHVAQVYEGLTFYREFYEVGAYEWNKHVYEMAGLNWEGTFAKELHENWRLVASLSEAWRGKYTLPLITDYFWNSLSTFKVLRYVW